MRSELRRADRGARQGRHESVELLRAHGVLAGHHSALPDGGVSPECAGHVAELDPNAANLDLIILAAAILDRSVGPLAPEVAGSIHS